MSFVVLCVWYIIELFSGKELCLGKPLDEELLKLIHTEVVQLEDAYKKLNVDVHDTVCFR